MDYLDKLKNSHSNKSKQLKLLRKKLGKRISVSKLEEILSVEKSISIDGGDYRTLYGYDETGYVEDYARRKARIELLEELIDLKK